MKSPLIGASYLALSNILDCQRCINWYPVFDEDGKVYALSPTPGKRLLATLGTGPIRGIHEFENANYVVSGSGLYQVLSTGANRRIGNVGGSGPVSMDDNGDQIFIAAGVQSWIYTVSTDALAQITDPDFPGASFVDYLDSYFVFTKPDSQQFYTTALGDGTNIDALDFASSEGMPDKIVSQIIDHREAWFFNKKSSEVFGDSGNADFPLDRISGGFVEQGCIAPHSPAKLDNSVFWIGNNDQGRGVIYRAAGYTPQRVSTHAIELLIAQSDDLENATAYTYLEEGHAFYVLNLSQTTVVFDAATGMWHERCYRNPTTAELERDRGDCHAMLSGLHVVGDYENGNLYILDKEVYTDNGDPIRRIRSGRHIRDENKWITSHEFQVHFKPGVGLSSGQGSDPQCMYKYSLDGGFTWSNEKWTSIGKIGKYKNRTRYVKNGSGRDRVEWIEVSDPVKAVIVDAYMRTTEAVK